MNVASALWSIVFGNVNEARDEEAYTHSLYILLGMGVSSFFLSSFVTYNDLKNNEGIVNRPESSEAVKLLQERKA